MKKVLTLCLITLLWSCGETEITRIVVDPGFSSYVSGFTSGIISSQSTIKVILIEPFEGAEDGTEIDKELFEFEPAIEGKAFWVDDQTIEFRPASKLPSGENFVGTFYLKELMQVPDEFEEMRFGFMVIKQNLFVAFEGLRSVDMNDFSKQELFGSLRTSDGADPIDIQACLVAEQSGKKLPIEWTHAEDGHAHAFTVKGVVRGEKASELALKWDGEPIGANVSDDLDVRIPPLGEFSLVQVNTLRAPSLHFSLQFSDPVDPNQDLTGLIHLNSGKDLRFSVDNNEIKAYPTEQLSSHETIVIEESVVNVKGSSLIESYFRAVEFNLEHPAVELLGDGVIMPSTGGSSFPFRAINLKAVNLRVIQIFEQNVPQFLQVNHLSGSREITRVGRMVADEQIDLVSDEGLDYGVWNNFSIDLSKIIQPQPGAIYRVTLSFSRHQSLYPCSETEADNAQPLRSKELNFDDGGNDYYSDYDYDYEYYYEYDYDYSERDNPCSPSFYMYNRRSISANLFSSDMGMIAKESSNDEYDVVITDLKSTDPMSGISVEAYNYQNRKIGEGRTSGDGVAHIISKGKPYLIVAKDANQRGYLRVDNGSALSVSLYEVGGQRIKMGVKGFLYGERGVWRPGDTIFLSFMLEDKQNALPKTHPVVLEFYDPLGRLYDRKVQTKGVEGLYTFKLKTVPEDITGNWMAKAIVGNSEFTKTLKIETIKPNRLKIDFDFDDVIGSSEDLEAELTAQWLYGSPGGGLKARVELEVENMKTQFKGFDGYQFDDRSRQFFDSDPIVSEQTTNSAGNARLTFDWEKPREAPGMLKMKFSTKVFEQGGDYSQDFVSTKYSPYSSYVGVKMPAGTNWITALNSEEEHAIAIAAVDENGKSISRKVTVELYKINWNWWWESNGESEIHRYIRRESSKLVKSEEFEVKNGRGVYDLSFPNKDYGKYLLRVVDEASGHSAAQDFFVEYPGWWNNTDEGTDAAAMLSLETKKPSYDVGEKIDVTVPSGGVGRIYVTVEKGDKILDQFWVKAESNHTSFSIDATKEMAPNVYVNAMLIQPHAQDENSLPIRMYGVIPVSINDASTRIQPVITAPAALQPEQKFQVKVSEKDGRAMAYTLAVVDEGLLGLTRFKTPEAWNSFYSKEALGVRTWDMYKYVMSAQTGKMASLLAIGGDEGLVYKEEEKANRFKPVVQFIGPFYLKKGETLSHNLKLPNYIGAVRVMVVAGYEGAYGSAEKEIQVKQPLMVLSTLPRVLGPSERITIPVNVIAMDDKIKQVNVKVTTNELLQLLGSTQQSVTFSKQGDKTVFFEFEVARQLGVAKFKVELSSGKETAFEEVELMVRPPNPAITTTESVTLEPDQNWSFDYKAFGITGTNKASLVVSSIPDLDLDRQLTYLIRYPHGCIEQTTSSVFPQLSLASLVELTPEQKTAIQSNISAGLARLRLFQLSDGGLTYWPGRATEASEWGTNYAGHFMVEAKQKGYELPAGLYDQWLKFQKNTAANWVRSRDERYGRYNSDITQAYRLFTLALANAADVGAMNRLRTDERLSLTGSWRLAAAYALIGREDVAKELANKTMEVETYREMSGSYGSRLRDMAMILETLTYLNDYERGRGLLTDMCAMLNTGWHSTQSRAYAMLAISKFIGGGDAPLSYAFTAQVNGSSKSFNSNLPVNKFDIDAKNIKAGSVAVANKSRQILFVSLVQTGMPVEANDVSVRDELKMTVSYRDLQNKSIDVSSLQQGQDFKATVTITHPGLRSNYEEIALTQIFPSGWQIVNSRLNDDGTSLDAPTIEFQDIRDDRVYSYFDLNRGKSITIEVLLNATFAGRFYKPAIFCAPMYDESIKALEPGRWVEVIADKNDQATVN